MDDSQFDGLAKSLAGPRSRRGTVSLLASSALSLFGIERFHEAEAKRKKRKKRKGKRNKKKCKRGKKRCGKACVDTKSDERHCGSCNEECEGGQRCFRGECVDSCSPVCVSPEVCCGADCTDLTTDAKHCGQCFNACAENEVCRFGNCTCPGPRCAIPGSNETRCCPAVDGVCCPTGLCCAAGNICTPDERCCPPNTYSCLDGTCCPFFLNCAGGVCVEP